MQNKKNHQWWFSAGIIAGAFCFGIASALVASAFNGPGNNSAGTGNGSIGVDAQNDLSVGTSTPVSGIRMLVVGSTTDTSAYALEIESANASPILYVRNDGGVSVGTTSVTAGTLTLQGSLVTTGNINTNIGASNVTAGTFASGNFAFPSSLGVNTSSQVGLPQALSVYGGLLVSNLGSSGSPCVSVGATGVLATTTCGGGGLSGGQNNYIPIWTSGTTLSTSTLQKTTNALVTTAGFAVGTTTDQAAGGLFVTKNVTTTNLTVTALSSGGSPCLVVSGAGVVSTSTCGGGSLSGGTNNWIPLWTGSNSLATSSLQANGATTYTLAGIAIGTSTTQTAGNIFITGNYLGGTISAGLVSSNVFGSGNFAFPSSLGVGTSSTAVPNTLSVYGTELVNATATFNGNIDTTVNSAMMSTNGSGVLQALSVGSYLSFSGNVLTVSSTLASSSVTFNFDTPTTTAPYNLGKIYTANSKLITYVDCLDYNGTTTFTLYYETSAATTSIKSGTNVLTSITCGVAGNSATSFTNATLPAGSYLFGDVTSTVGSPSYVTLDIQAKAQ